MKVRIRYYYDQYWGQQIGRGRYQSTPPGGPCRVTVEWAEPVLPGEAVVVNSAPGIVTASNVAWRSLEVSAMTFEEARDSAIRQFTMTPPTEELDIERLPLEDTTASRIGSDGYVYVGVEEALPRL